MNFSKKKKFFQLWKALVIAHLAVFIFACPAASDTSSNSDDKSPLDETKLKVARITADHGDVLSAGSGFANGDYESVEFIKGHKVTSIEKGAFEGNKISKITIPAKVTHLGKNAFKGNPLTEVTFKGNVETIEEGALATTEDSLKVILEEDKIDGFKEGGAFAAEKIADALGDKDKTVKFEKSANTKQLKSVAVDALIAAITTKVAAIKSLKKVTFDSKDGSFVNPKFVVSGQSVTEPAKPTKEGNGFVGWYAAENLTGSVYDFSTTVSEDKTLYAKWDSTIVTIESVSITSSPTSGQNDYYKKDDEISIKLTFTEEVTAASNPVIMMKTSSGDIALAYDSDNTSGKGVAFKYAVKAADNFSNIYISLFTLDSGQIQNNSKNVSLTYAGKLFDIKVDGVKPTIAGVAFAGEAKAYKTDDKIEVEVTFTEEVTVDTSDGTNKPFIVVKVGDNNRNAEYAGDDGAKSIKHTFEYTVVSGDDDKDGIEIEVNKFDLSSGVIKDAAGNVLTVLNNSAVTMDSTRTVNQEADDNDGQTSQQGSGSSKPTVTQAVLKNALTKTAYKAGDDIEVEVTFSENVTVDTKSDTNKPFIKLRLNNDVKAEYKSGSGSSKLTFEYRVKNGDTAVQIEILANSLDANSPGTLQNSGGVDFDLKHSQSINSLHIVDTTAPTVTGITFGGPSEIYNTGDEIPVEVTFSEAVTVDTNGANKPFIVVQVGSNPRNAEYADDGMSKNTHIFKYTVVSGDDDKDGIEIAVNKFDLNNGTITDAAGNVLTVETSSAVEQDTNRLVNALFEGDTLQFFDDTSKDLLSGVTIADGSDGFTSGAQWLTNKVVHEGSTINYGVKVDAAVNKKFSLSPKVTPAIAGSHSGHIEYSAGRYVYRDNGTQTTVGDPVSEVLDISPIGEITLKDATKGGRYVIKATKPETDNHKKSTATYTLWVMVNSELSYPTAVSADAFLKSTQSDLFATKDDVFKYKHLNDGGRKIEVVDKVTEDSQQIVINADAFTFVFGKHENDKGGITYALKPGGVGVSEGTNVLTVNANTGLVTVVDASTLLKATDPYVVVGTKTEWEYFKSNPKEYSIDK